MKTVLLTFLVGTSLSLITSVFAQDNKDHATQNKIQNPSLQNQQAIMALEEGFAFMEETVSEKNREEMFNNGPIMEAWHEKLNAIGEATEV